MSKEALINFGKMWKVRLETPVDTTDLQIATLTSFLNDLGYLLSRNKDHSIHVVKADKDEGSCEEYPCKVCIAPLYLSFNLGVALYNGNVRYRRGDKYVDMMGLCLSFCRGRWDNACKNKIITKVSLRREKGSITATSDWVKFTEKVSTEAIDPLESY